MSNRFDAIVVGLGGMGSAALYHLARRGARVIGIDQFSPPHTLGSSHGETRVIREAYFEHPSYVPLVQRAYELWADLERAAEKPLYVKTGGIMIGYPGSTIVEGSRRSAMEHRLPYEALAAAEIRARFSGFRPHEDMVGIFEPRAGILFPEACVEAHLRLAERAGAVLKTNEPVTDWRAADTRIEVRTAQGTYQARQLVLCGGAWMPELLRNARVPLQIERQVLLWFEARRPELFTPDRFPIHLWEYEPDRFFYGFPDLGTGVKLAFHHQGEIGSRGSLFSEVLASDIESLRQAVAPYLPEALGRYLRGTVCRYTNTPDGHFLIDRHPEHDNVIVASPCSGHGFKFASAVGEALAELAIVGRPRLNLDFLSARRFGYFKGE